MFCELLEAVIKCMIIVQVLNFDPATEILKIRCHIYISMKIAIILRKIHVKMKSFIPPQKETNHSRLNCDYIKYQNRRSRIVQMRKAAIVGVLRKRVSFKILQNSQETPVPGSTCEFCKIFKNTFFTEQLRTTASKSGYCNNKARDIDCICCRELDAMSIASTKIPEGEGRISPSSFYEHLPYYQSHLLVLST